MRRRFGFPLPLPALAGLALATLGLLLLTLQVRGMVGLGGVALERPPPFEFNVYWLGVAVRELAVPVAILYALTGVGPVRALLRGDSRRPRRDAAVVLALLVATQAAFFASSGPQSGAVTLGHVVVLVAGFVLGWPGGAALGLLSAAALAVPDLQWVDWQETALGDALRWHFVYDLEFVSTLWLGLAAGLLAPLVRRWRFAPPATGAAALLLALAARWTIGATIGDDAWRWTWWTERLVPGVLACGVGATLVALVFRNALADADRRHAEATRLALAQAELRALRSQINPHFLFNALGTIRHFVRAEPERARDLLVDLSDLFRRAVEADELVPLEDELAHVRAYLALESARLGDRLSVVWFVQDDALLRQPVPVLTLQPIVENAIQHGVALRPEGGTVTISALRTDGRLLLRVQDDGLGFDPGRDDAAEGSVGLANIRARLERLYGLDRGSSGGAGARARARLDLVSTPGRGSVIELAIPLGVAPDAAGGARPLERPAGRRTEEDPVAALDR